MQMNDDVTDEILDYIKKTHRCYKKKKKKEIDNGVVYYEAEKDIESVAYERWLRAEQMCLSYEDLYHALDILKKLTQPDIS